MLSQEGGCHRLGLRRQTPQQWKYTARRGVLAFLWGTDIGSGVSTFRVTSAIWLVCAALLLGLVPLWVGALYGVGLALVLATALNLGIVGPAVEARLDAFRRARRWLQAVHVGALAILGALLLAQ